MRFFMPFLNVNIRVIWFQQDNTRCPIACIATYFLEQENIEALPWSALSPDLSPDGAFTGFLRQLCEAPSVGDVTPTVGLSTPGVNQYLPTGDLDTYPFDPTAIHCSKRCKWWPYSVLPFVWTWRHNATGTGENLNILTWNCCLNISPHKFRQFVYLLLKLRVCTYHVSFIFLLSIYVKNFFSTGKWIIPIICINFHVFRYLVTLNLLHYGH